MSINPKDIDRQALRKACKDPKAFLQGLQPQERLRFLFSLSDWAPRQPSGAAYVPPGRWYLPRAEDVIYGLAAHLRGRLHGGRKYNPVFDSSGTLRADERTLEDQEELLQRVWPFFARPEVRARLEAERLAAIPPHLS